MIKNLFLQINKRKNNVRKIKFQMKSYDFKLMKFSHKSK